MLGDYSRSFSAVHTSGTSVLNDDAQGRYKGDKIYHDDRREEIDSVPDNAPHREIDLAIVKAQKELGEAAKIAIMIRLFSSQQQPVAQLTTCSA